MAYTRERNVNQMYKNYVFDLYGTLVDIRTNENKAYLWKKLSEFYALYGAHYEPAQLKQVFNKCVRDEEQKLYDSMKKQDGINHISDVEIKLENVFINLFNQKGVKADKTLAIHTGQMFRVISMKYEKVYEGVFELLDELKRAGKDIYLLSNAQYIFTAYELDALGLSEYFKGIMISSEEGCKKPSYRFYNTLLKRFNLDVKETIMIGNDQYADIQGAKKIGLDTLYIHTDISPDYIEDECPAEYRILDGDFKKVSNLILKNK